MKGYFKVYDIYNLFDKLAGDLYPSYYNLSFCQELVEKMNECLHIALTKGASIFAHNYQRPEIQELASQVGDSLGLSLWAAKTGVKDIRFCSVEFMAQTAKIIVGDNARVYLPQIAGCSLVDSINHQIINRWKESYPDGIIITYINSDPRTKGMSDYVFTSRNATQVLLKASQEFPQRPILFLPDKYLGAVAIAQVRQLNPDFDSSLVTLYEGSCHVHVKIGERALEDALENHPEGELLIHPECGCASSCLLKTVSGTWPYQNAYYLSTEGMINHAKKSNAKEFIVATESGMVYRLRKEIPEKRFIPVSYSAVCEYMKEITIDNLLTCLKEDIHEVHIDEETRASAKGAIDRMLTII